MVNQITEWAKNNIPHLRTFLPYLEEVQKESTRGAILMTAGYLEQQTIDILKAFFCETEATVRLFNGSNAPLHSFSGRIDLCFALGLIRENEHNDLTIIRKIRNEAAHQVHIDFDSQSIKDRCANLQLAAEDYDHPKHGPIRLSAAARLNSAAIAIILRFINRPTYVAKYRCAPREWPY